MSKFKPKYRWRDRARHFAVLREVKGLILDYQAAIHYGVIRVGQKTHFGILSFIRRSGIFAKHPDVTRSEREARYDHPEQCD